MGTSRAAGTTYRTYRAYRDHRLPSLSVGTTLKTVKLGWGSANDHFRPSSGEAHLRQGGIHGSGAEGLVMLEGLTTRVRRSVVRERGGVVVANDAKLRLRTTVGQSLSPILVADAEGRQEQGVDIGASKEKVSRVEARRETSWLSERDGEGEGEEKHSHEHQTPMLTAYLLPSHNHNAPTLPPSATLFIASTAAHRTRAGVANLHGDGRKLERPRVDDLCTNPALNIRQSSTQHALDANHDSSLARHRPFLRWLG
ncbi:hypothetical protein FA13DRAFT_1178462 [Coprinellus micaceus]|uniref:Uncharacterized protein n=1 Tax=Coprinellus micaceus TaxID=71717 RepID=A0A4Y7SUN1_COPMI|nr:hypothetical protein FA13DRAFT_1178462 [Coprinellus micaceus]